MSDSKIVEMHVECPACPSTDGFCVYDDGHGFCFVCHTYVSEAGEVSKAPKTNNVSKDFNPIWGEYTGLRKRRLSEETCRRFGYRVAELDGEKVHIADYYDQDGNLVAQKIRHASKKFWVNGDINRAALYGQQLWGRSDGGKMLVVTEGELDAMSVSEAHTGRKWPVVSVPQGAKQAAKFCKANLEFLEKFQKVVFMFDGDELGQEAAKECALLMTPGKGHIATLELKDASDMLQAGKRRELNDAPWNARPYQPDGIVMGDPVWEAITYVDTRPTMDWPYEFLNEKTGGLRAGELYVVCAGTGLGKSTLLREAAYKMIQDGARVGYVALEENIKTTAMGLMSIHLEDPLHLKKPADLPAAKVLRAAYEATCQDVVFYDHFGSLDVDRILAKVRYMAKGCDCTVIIFDHLTAVVSDQEEDERKALDRLVTRLASIANETGATILAISHLSKPPGQAKSHEEGGRVSLRHLRGSNSIAQWSYICLALERDQQAEEEDERNVAHVRILKNRWSGVCGPAGQLHYDLKTGRLRDYAGSAFDQGKDF